MNSSSLTELTEIFGDVADAIREKLGTQTTYSPRDFAAAIASISGGGTPAISVVDTPDAHGGTVRTITALDISDTTAIASVVQQGYYFYTADGQKTAGTASGGSTPSATQHTIYFEFSDDTNTTITAYYDSTFISDAITATTPATYGGKTVTLAELDGVAWYEPSAIPLNTQLIDYTAVKTDTAINSSGAEEAAQWYYASDYTPVATGMEFSYKASLWHYIGLYDSDKNVLDTIYVYNDATVDPNNSNTGIGTLSGNELPASVAYVRMAAVGTNSSYMSLIRTA